MIALVEREAAQLAEGRASIETERTTQGRSNEAGRREKKRVTVRETYPSSVIFLDQLFDMLLCEQR